MSDWTLKSHRNSSCRDISNSISSTSGSHLNNRFRDDRLTVKVHFCFVFVFCLKKMLIKEILIVVALLLVTAESNPVGTSTPKGKLDFYLSGIVLARTGR